MRTDPLFCANSFLTYRAIVDRERQFTPELPPFFYENPAPRTGIADDAALEAHLRGALRAAVEDGPVALMLSSGMDSAILAAMLPPETQTYTLRCVAQSGIDETEAAAVYARRNGLRHSVVDVTWEDYEAYTLPLMRRKGCPIHSIEVQIYKAALRAKEDGIRTLIFGETADILYGGHSSLLSRDYTLEQFARRFAFVDVEQVMRKPQHILDPILPHVQPDGTVDVFGFLNAFEYDVSLGFYNNACGLGGVNFFSPYASSVLSIPLDLARIRRGESKYIIRQLYARLYPDLPMPDKTPLPRPMGEWLRDWTGPLHSALRGDQLHTLSGDQKWYVYTLNQFLLECMGDADICNI